MSDDGGHGSDDRRQRFLDGGGRLVIWPARRNDRLDLLEYVVDKFEEGYDYTESQVNDLLRLWHTWNDPAQLRRMLVDEGFVARSRDGGRYWRVADGPVRA